MFLTWRSVKIIIFCNTALDGRVSGCSVLFQKVFIQLGGCLSLVYFFRKQAPDESLIERDFFSRAKLLIKMK